MRYFSYFFRYDIPFVRVAKEVKNEFSGQTVPHDQVFGHANEPEPDIADHDPDSEQADRGRGPGTCAAVGLRRLLV